MRNIMNEPIKFQGNLFYKIRTKVEQIVTFRKGFYEETVIKKS